MEVVVVVAFIVALLLAFAYAAKRADRRGQDSAEYFKIEEWISSTPPARVVRPAGPASDDFDAITERNLTARCYFTGTEVGSCTCSKHRKKV